MKLTGLILAGGAATRFGADKTLVEVEGVPLVARVAHALAEVPVDGLVVASGTPQRAFAHTAALVDLEVPVRAVPDLDPTASHGPLAGVMAAMPAARGDWIALAPADAPFLSPALYRLLAERAQVHGTGAAVMTEEGPHPLLAVVERGSLHRLARMMWVLGERSLRAVLEDVQYAPVTLDEVRAVDPELESLLVVHAPEDVD